MKQAAPPKCPKCGDDSNIVCHGKRYSVYPSGCLVIIGYPFAILHQTSCPIDYECQTCHANFGIRSSMAKIALGLLFLIPFLIIGAIVSQFVSD